MNIDSSYNVYSVGMHGFLRVSYLAILLLRPLIGNAQVSELFVTSPATSSILVVRHGEIIRKWQVPLQSSQAAIAVSSDVRTCGLFGGQGWVFDRFGQVTGWLRGNSLADSYDGTTDGRLNYTVSYESGTVLACTREWTDPRLVFTTKPFVSAMTFDTATGGFWIADHYSYRTELYSANGQLLRSFQSPSQLVIGLALDPADGTLWYTAAFQPNVLYQSDRSGSLIKILFVPEMGAYLPLGMEFAVAPRTTR